jgi:hypothetical protein
MVGQEETMLQMYLLFAFTRMKQGSPELLHVRLQGLGSGYAGGLVGDDSLPLT